MRRCLAVHPTQTFILSCSDDMLIKLWDWEKVCLWLSTLPVPGSCMSTAEIIVQRALNSSDVGKRRFSANIFIQFARRLGRAGLGVHPDLRGPLALRHAVHLQPEGHQHLRQRVAGPHRQGLLSYQRLSLTRTSSLSAQKRGLLEFGLRGPKQCWKHLLSSECT